MATDLDLNSNKDIHLDGGNDLALVSGTEQVKQSAAISVFDVTSDLVGSNLDGTTVNQIENDIREALNENGQLGRIISVELQTYDMESDTITVDANVADGTTEAVTINT